MKESGAQQAWLQECMVPHWIRGGKDEMWSNTLVSGDRSKKPDARLVRKDYDIAALGNSVGSGPAGVSGEVMLVNSFDELEKRKDEVKGKIVFYNYKFNPTYVNTFLSYRDARIVPVDRAPAVRPNYGAKAVIIRIRVMRQITIRIPVLPVMIRPLKKFRLWRLD